MKKECWCALWCVAALAVAGCRGPGELSAFTLQAAASRAGSLLAYGECAAPDGALVLIHARGGEQLGAQLEAAILTPVVKGRYVADLGLFEPAAYALRATLSPAFNEGGPLPKQAYGFHDPELTIREDAGGWEISRALSYRLGAPDDERASAQRHLAALAAGLQALEKCAQLLRETEAGGKAEGLARQYRLCWESRRNTALDAEGVDPLYPALHGRLREADETLARRWHGALAQLTGATDEIERLGAAWPLVDQRLARVREELSALQAKAATP